MSINLIKTEVRRFGFFIIVLLVIVGCKSEELTGRQIIERAVEAHGGSENWEMLKQLSFDKETTLFLEDGSTEIHTEQFQLFRKGSKLFGKIEWQNKQGQEIQIIYENEKIFKSINDSMVTDSRELVKAESSFWAAQYVAFKPFDLLLDYTGLSLVDEIEFNDKSCYVVSVFYEGEEETNSDRWFYIIDKNSFEIVANKVELTDHTSWVENLSFDTSTDFKFNAHRKSYRLNEQGEKTYLRAEYFYSNFSVQY